MFVGNGGSAGIASHPAIDFPRTPICARLRSTSSALPASATIRLRECIRQADRIPRACRRSPDRDSSSGGSANILNAVKAARARNCRGDVRASRPTTTARSGDINFYVPSREYGFVEVAHLALCHAVLDLDIGWGNRPRPAAVQNKPERARWRTDSSVSWSPAARAMSARTWCRSCWRPATKSTVLDLYLYGDDVRGPREQSEADRGQGRPAQPRRRASAR